MISRVLNDIISINLLYENILRSVCSSNGGPSGPDKE